MTDQRSRSKEVAGVVAGGGCLSVIALIAIAVGVGMNADVQKQRVQFDAGHAVTVSAHYLFSQFNDNEIDAKNRFGSKSFILTGTIAEIQSGDPATVTFDEGPSIYHVEAMVADEQKLAPFRPGDEVEMHCTGAELSLGDVIANACNWIGKTPTG